MQGVSYVRVCAMSAFRRRFCRAKFLSIKARWLPARHGANADRVRISYARRASPVLEVNSAVPDAVPASASHAVPTRRSRSDLISLQCTQTKSMHAVSMQEPGTQSVNPQAVTRLASAQSNAVEQVTASQVRLPPLGAPSSSGPGPTRSGFSPATVGPRPAPVTAWASASVATCRSEPSAQAARSRASTPRIGRTAGAGRRADAFPLPSPPAPVL
jgi:hypothetical protein